MDMLCGVDHKPEEHFKSLIYQKTSLFFQKLEPSVATASQNILNQTGMFNLTSVMN